MASLSLVSNRMARKIATRVAGLNPGSSGGRALLLSAILLGIGIAVSAGLLVAHQRQRALATSGRDLERVALVLAHQAERTLQAVELVQSSIVERLKDVTTPEQFRQELTGLAVHQDLRARIHGLPQIGALNAMDANGDLVNSSRYWPLTPVNVADRDFFKALTADPQLMTFVSQPARNRMTGTWAVYLARKVVAPDGAFLGLILVALDLDYFEHLYEAVSFGSDSSVTLFRQDGVMLARHPHIEPDIGRSFGIAAVFRQLLETGLRDNLDRRTSSVDGQEKLSAMQLLLTYPLAISVSVTLDQALAEWRKQAAYLLAAAALLELMLVGTGLLVRRQLRSQRLLTEAHAELVVARERDRAQARARIQDARFGAALDNMSQGLGMFDAENRLVVANARYVEMFDLPADIADRRPHFGDLIDLAEARGMLTPDEGEALKVRTRACIAAGERVSYVRDRKNGRSLSICFSPAPDGGWLVTYEDITERRRAEAQIAHMAHHDALTGLPNRVLFHKRLETALAWSRRDETFAVLYLDLDHFKAVNDTLGHPKGDALLRAVTERLLMHVRETDTVARLGGDEFAIIQGGVDQPRDATVLSERLIETLSAPYEFDGHTITIGTSIGIAMLPGDGADADAVLKNADLALYRAKADGRGTYRFFEPHMDATMQARRALELDLRHAMTAGQFVLFYQPVIDLSSRQVSGFEALIRWHHPERGLLPPSTFIPLAEEIGLIVPIGEWVLHRACTDAMDWPSKLKVSVNLSSVQFSGRGPVPAVMAALAASGLDPARLELEITETVMLDDTDATLLTLRSLKALGVTIAMDDFGTGYSSLAYLRKFPFDRVKIDKSFITDLGRSIESVAIVQAVTTLCRTLGMSTTVEGVETEAQLQRLRLGNCTNVQGFLFSEPRPAAEVAELCRTLGPTVAVA